MSVWDKVNYTIVTRSRVRVILDRTLKCKMDQANQRSRGWVFTLNNPHIQPVDYMSPLQSMLKYWVIGKEVGQSGTPHFQGYMFYENAQRFTTVKSHVHGSHIEKQRGSIEQAINYCKKDGNFEEWGNAPQENNENRKSQWSTIISKARAGDLQYVEENHPAIFLRYLPRLKELSKPTTAILENLQNEWWYGETGTGKSMKAWNDYPDHFQKKKNKWWDGYNHQETVVIEEWSPDYHMLATALKEWSDRYPFPGEIKGGLMQNIRPTRIIITSNYSMEECFPRHSDLKPLKRRFKQVHFPVTPFHQASNAHNEVNDEDFLDNEITDFITSLIN